jgi:hypothetical protein
MVYTALFDLIDLFQSSKGISRAPPEGEATLDSYSAQQVLRCITSCGFFDTEGCMDSIKSVSSPLPRRTLFLSTIKHQFVQLNNQQPSYTIVYQSTVTHLFVVDNCLILQSIIAEDLWPSLPSSFRAVLIESLLIILGQVTITILPGLHTHAYARLLTYITIFVFLPAVIII